ncbi:protein-disulfide reductase DsbD domain-containing protein [Roseobacter sp. HKCCA0434]|uniref:protein-disulfide reductase DsbD domain-containing protein n=1 Tax=Roseobacter sp. HKCCA0434 TaxID=3079297 RepID=UPI002905F261|nr:protein-disulfide reductase DsbD domain-containing protein [Roseobacter sp. HKCCA0434]
MQMKFALGALALFVAAATAQAQTDNPYSQVRIVEGHMLADGRYLAGVEIALAQGWKTYWREPGEGGIPPFFDWSTSTGVAISAVEWPVPEIFETYGLRSLGYRDRVLFPMIFDVLGDASEAELRLSLDYGLCSDVCIPATATATLPVDLDARRNEAALAAARHQGNGPQSVEVACDVVPAAGAFRLDALARLDGMADARTVAVFETPDPDLWIGTAERVEQGDGQLFSAPMDWFGDGAFALSRETINTTFVNSGEWVVTVEGC